MIASIKRKINSQTGESITETLVALLIAALALVMLAGAMSASTNIVLRSREKLKSYYDENEKDSGIVKKASKDNSGIISISEEGVMLQSISVYYFKNDVIGKMPVVSYKEEK